jgi:hypothetical protein
MGFCIGLEFSHSDFLVHRPPSLLGKLLHVGDVLVVGIDHGHLHGAVIRPVFNRDRVFESCHALGARPV